MTNWIPDGLDRVDQYYIAFANCPDCFISNSGRVEGKVRIKVCPAHVEFLKHPEQWDAVVDQPTIEKVVEFEEGFSMPCFDKDTFSWVLNPKFDYSERLWLKSVLKPGMTFWDVGANNGLYTGAGSCLVGPKGHVVAFEPEPGAYSRLNKTIAHNGFENVIPANLALAHIAREFPFYLALKGNDGGLGTNEKAQNPSIPILSETIDRLLSQRYERIDTRWAQFSSYPPHVLKIDANGTEWSVLEGARGYLSEAKIPIMCKVDKDYTFLGKDSLAIYDAVPDCYRWYKIIGDGTLMEHERRTKPFPGHANLVGLAT